MTYNIIIIEDQQNLSDLLQDLLQENCPELKVIGVANTTDKAIKMVQAFKPHLLFMNMAMPGLDALDLLKSLAYQKFDIIFTTAYGHYALKAFDHNSVYHFLKPASKEKLTNGVLKYLQHTQAPIMPIAPVGTDMFKIINQLDIFNKKIKLPRINGFTMIQLNEIIRLEADGRYTKVIIMECKPNSEKQKTELICLNIKELEEQINSTYFFRCHHSHLVNLKKVKCYTKGQGGILGMDNGESVPVAKSKKEGLLKRLDEI